MKFVQIPLISMMEGKGQKKAREQKLLTDILKSVVIVAGAFYGAYLFLAAFAGL